LGPECRDRRHVNDRCAVKGTPTARYGEFQTTFEGQQTPLLVR
jgi:hypothetical protein